jgi:hypothetical protein
VRFVFHRAVQRLAGEGGAARSFRPELSHAALPRPL